MPNTDVSPNWSDVEQAAKVCANNHAKFDSFAWMNEPPDSERFMIYYTSNRDSGLLSKSNEDAILKTMLRFKNVREERHNHWAVGYVDGLVLPVYLKDGKTVSKAFTKLCELMARLEDYPVLDESDYSDREYEATLENIENAGRSLVKGGAPDDWASKVFSWFWDHNQGAVENSDDRGGYPSEDEMKEALQELGILDPRQSANELEDFPVGLRVYVGEPDTSDNTLWKKPFVGTVFQHDEDKDVLVVFDDSGQCFEVLPGEVIGPAIEEDDPNQFRLFYVIGENLYTYDEYVELKQKTEKDTIEDE